MASHRAWDASRGYRGAGSDQRWSTPHKSDDAVVIRYVVAGSVLAVVGMAVCAFGIVYPMILAVLPVVAFFALWTTAAGESSVSAST